MKYYMYVNPWFETSCISHIPMEFERFAESFGLEEDFSSEEAGFFFESPTEDGPWVHIKVERKVVYTIKLYAKESK